MSKDALETIIWWINKLNLLILKDLVLAKWDSIGYRISRCVKIQKPSEWKSYNHWNINIIKSTLLWESNRFVRTFVFLTKTSLKESNLYLCYSFCMCVHVHVCVMFAVFTIRLAVCFRIWYITSIIVELNKESYKMYHIFVKIKSQKVI